MMSIFGLPEMRAFAENHEDPRVVAIWLRFEETRRKSAEWCDEAIEQRNRAKELETKLNLLVDSINLQRLECQQGKNLNEANYRLWEAVKPMLQEGVRRMRGKKNEAGDER